jgi:cupin fold WbuC family metalloprotein
MNWIKLSTEVYGTDASIVSIGARDINMLKEKVLTCPSKRIRICVHRSADDLLHEMLIVIAKGSYIRPHKHVNKGESFHLIEGMLDIVIFHDDGTIMKVISLGEPQSGKQFFYRLSAPYFHTLILRTDWVVFHEATNGPFRKEETVYAPWAPEQGDALQEEKFQHNLAAKIL